MHVKGSCCLTAGHIDLDAVERAGEAEAYEGREAASSSDEDEEEATPADARPEPLHAEGGEETAEPPGTSGRSETEHRDGSGGPAPLHPSLVTLALLPRSQWQGLVHLDAIKARPALDSLFPQHRSQHFVLR
jgi:hypothetical protein